MHLSITAMEPTMFEILAVSCPPKSETITFTYIEYYKTGDCILITRISSLKFKKASELPLLG